MSNLLNQPYKQLLNITTLEALGEDMKKGRNISLDRVLKVHLFEHLLRDMVSTHTFVSCVALTCSTASPPRKRSQCADINNTTETGRVSVKVIISDTIENTCCWM